MAYKKASSRKFAYWKKRTMRYYRMQLRKRIRGREAAR